ncbi:hypothetical protein RER_20630 [Rhodococcus erythropolis PR4]|uniref:Uncharacterized protein n=2 Tax=Rhodococcus erythropolis TaxID=1833 RepID=C0ZWN6_RHOE4|nr:hypothetical protein RER_20630 [Rhodococcus erythropolis PR4]
MAVDTNARGRILDAMNREIVRSVYAQLYDENNSRVSGARALAMHRASMERLGWSELAFQDLHSGISDEDAALIWYRSKVAREYDAAYWLQYSKENRERYLQERLALIDMPSQAAIDAMYGPAGLPESKS